MGLFKIPIIVIFAREFWEACVIIGQYRSVVKVQGWDESRTQKSLRVIWLAAGIAAFVAAVMITILGIALNSAGDELDEKAVELIEGISKIVAAICIGQLSLKIPKWLGFYTAKKEKVIGVTTLELLFNVAWNIWREMAEIGAFLIPFFLDKDELEAIPLSGVLGIVIGLVLGGVIYYLNGVLKQKVSLAVFMALVTGWLSAGLFTGGCHELEEVYGETAYVWKIKSSFLSNKKLPFALLKPFGWSHKPTILWLICFFAWAALLVAAHAVKMYLSRGKQLEQKELQDDSNTASPKNDEVAEKSVDSSVVQDSTV